MAMKDHNHNTPRHATRKRDGSHKHIGEIQRVNGHTNTVEVKDMKQC